MPPRKRAPAKKTPAKRVPVSRGQQLVKPDQEIKKAVRRRTPAAETPPPVALTQVRIHKRTYPLVRDPGCPVCQHPMRVEIEERLLYGDRYTSIAQELSGRLLERLDGETERLPELTAVQISRHFNADHSPLDARVLHDIQAEVAGMQAEDYEKAGGRLVDGLAFAKRIIGEVDQAVVRGEQTPTIKEGLAAARLDVAHKLALSQVEATGGGSQDWFYEQAFEVYFDHAREIMNPDQWQTFMDALYQNQVLQSLIQRRNGAVDARVLEERPA